MWDIERRSGSCTPDRTMPLLTDDMTEPNRPVTRRELREELQTVLKTLATNDAAAESCTSQFDMLHDALRAHTTGLDKRVKAVESGHGGRLLRLETRVTAVELGHPRKKG